MRRRLPARCGSGWGRCWAPTRQPTCLRARSTGGGGGAGPTSEGGGDGQTQIGSLPPLAPSTHRMPPPACSLCYRLLKYRMSDLAGAGRDRDFTVYDQVGTRRESSCCTCQLCFCTLLHFALPFLPFFCACLGMQAQTGTVRSSQHGPHTLQPQRPPAASPALNTRPCCRRRRRRRRRCCRPCRSACWASW